MGYTHYWDQTDTVAPADWIEFAEGAERLVALVIAGGVVLKNAGGERGKPVVNGREVSFNGAKDQRHEGFAITRKLADDWTFCKTARKDYDTAVAAVLCYLDSILPGTFKTRSDGALWNYRDALELAKAAWPQKANQLDFPRSLKEKARWEGKDEYGDDYQVVKGLDGVTYIEEVATQDLRRVSDEMQNYGEWSRNLPHEMRKWGSFAAHEHARCEALRLLTVWNAATPVPPVVYDPIVHGLRHPELTSAQTY